MSMYNPPAPGLTTQEAFSKLFHDVNKVIESYKSSRRRTWSDIIKSSFSTRSHHTSISWCSFLILVIESLIILSLASANYGTVWRSLFLEAIVMLLLVFFNAALMIWENYKRYNELPVKLEKILSSVKESVTTWEDSNYPDLYMPLSPCISMQWCYRDGRLVNLPWSFLVAGDLIILLPGQKIIAKCHLLNDQDIILDPGTTFVPAGAELETPDLTQEETPNLHTPMESTFAVVLETPYMLIVQSSFDSFLKRPKTFYIKERHRIVNGLIECVILPLALMIFVSVCIVRMFYLPHWLGIRVAPWTEILILQPLVNTFSLIPVALPFLYVFLHCIANAKIHTLYRVLKNSRNMQVDVEEKESVPALTYYHVDLSLFSIYKEVWAFFKGREETLHRSQKLLHIFATVTALCCVDKKGVLSWPNPTADKVFFLKTRFNPTTKRREVSQEILDLTHDNRNAFELHFDDHNWEGHLSSLKPIGLNILLNNCNYRTRATYSCFHSHITNELQTKANDLVVPVVARRCLCELARLIGFTEKATTVFSLEQELCSYRHIESDAICRDKFTRAKIKFPFPHMMSIVIKEKIYNTLQLMSQGTGDMILDICDDFWDGSDLRPLNSEERKAILDFYQRSSLTSVCAAFAYKPLQAKVSQHLASFYMELPPSKGTRYLPYYAFSAGPTSHFLAKDGSISSDCIYNLAEKKKSGEREVTDVDGCFEVQTSQIFLGMVAMQYEACMDMVQLIEQLDLACVRFVHFSKENELRSRVFSEKMGLESGWNCHISLRPLTDDEKLEEERMEREQSLFTQRSSDPPDSIHFYSTSETDGRKFGQVHPSQRRPTLNEIFAGSKRPSLNDQGDGDEKMLPRCSASVPEMVMLSRREISLDPEEKRHLLASPCGDDGPLSSSEDDERTNSCEVNGHVCFIQQQSGSDSSLSPVPPIPTKDLFQEESFSFLTDPLASSTLREKESVIRFADSVDEDSGTVVNGNSDGLRVETAAEAFARQRNLTPTESFNDAYEMAENKTPLGYDMSNRAKLPRGIEEVRPHLENVDNVPLLVSLFTDCTAENSREMIKIMQDYGEVIVLIGSVSNHENPGLFLQADGSVGLEPLYPQACQKQEIFVPPNPGKVSPTEVSMLLTSLPCALALKRSDPISFYHLIAHSRHYMNNCIRNSIQFWLCCQISMTLLALISSVMLIPPLFTIADTMWMSCVIIPILSLTLSFGIMDTIDPETMELSSWKNQVTLDKNILLYVLYFYGIRFIPSLFNLSLMASFNLRWICESHLKNMNNTCSWVYPVLSPTEAKMDEKLVGSSMKCISSWYCGDNAEKLLFIQQYSVFFLVLYYIIISASFVYRTKQMWVRNPFTNRTWITACIVVLLIQFVYAIVRLRITSISSDLVLGASYTWAFFWAPLTLGLNELLKRQEIKMNIRFQKRARLDYGTKLGMNSPF